MYVQGTRLGLASYWFDRDITKSYICYDPIECSHWLLDNGERPPERKYFENASYDPATRTFRGIIRWEPVRFHGDSMWTYTVIFNQDFTAISHGQVESEGASPRRHLYGMELVYRLAAGPGALERLKSLVLVYTLALSTVSKRRGRASRCSLTILPQDVLLRLLKSFLVET